MKPLDALPLAVLPEIAAIFLKSDDTDPTVVEELAALLETFYAVTPGRRF